MDKLTHDNMLKAHCFSDYSASDYLVKYKNILEMLSERLEQTRDNEYLVFYEDSGEVQRYSYSEFISKMSRLSNFLLKEA